MMARGECTLEMVRVVCMMVRLIQWARGGVVAWCLVGGVGSATWCDRRMYCGVVVCRPDSGDERHVQPLNHVESHPQPQLLRVCGQHARDVSGGELTPPVLLAVDCDRAEHSLAVLQGCAELERSAQDVLGQAVDLPRCVRGRAWACVNVSVWKRVEAFGSVWKRVEA